MDKKKNVFLRDKDKRELFRQFFVKLKRKHNLKNDLESVLWAHLKAIGCDEPEKFEKGIKHFGLKF